MFIIFYNILTKINNILLFNHLTQVFFEHSFLVCFSLSHNCLENNIQATKITLIFEFDNLCFIFSMSLELTSSLTSNRFIWLTNFLINIKSLVIWLCLVSIKNLWFWRFSFSWFIIFKLLISLKSLLITGEW